MRSAVVVLALAAATRAHAGGFSIPEIGLRETAMGAVIGRPDDGSAIIHDPAGLVLDDDWRLDVSAGLALPRTELRLAPWDGSDQFLGTTAEPDGYYAGVQPSRAFAVIPMISASGAVIPHRLYAGGALFVGNATGAAFPATANTRYHLIDGYVIAPQLMAATAYRIDDRLSLGASLGVVNLRVHGHRLVYPIIMGTDASSIVGTRPDLVLDGSAWAPAWSIGAFGRPHPRVTWGAAMIGRIDANLEGPITITYSDDAASPGDTLVGRQTTKQLLPWQFNAGGNVDVTPQLELGVEARYWLYHQYKSQHTDVVGIFLVKQIDVPKNFTDSLEVSAGARVHDLAFDPALELMAGTNYDHAPAPANTLTFDQPIFSHYGIHVGARRAFGRVRVGASYTHYWYSVPTVSDSITIPPTNFEGHGVMHIITLTLETRL